MWFLHIREVSVPCVGDLSTTCQEFSGVTEQLLALIS